MSIGGCRVKILSLKIEKCESDACPYHHYNVTLECYACTHNNNSRYYRSQLLWSDEFIEGFPDWCPLEDVE